MNYIKYTLKKVISHNNGVENNYIMDEFKWAADSTEENKCKTKNNKLMTIIYFESLRIYYKRQTESRTSVIFPITWWSQGKGEILVFPLKIGG